MKARSCFPIMVFAACMPGTHHPYARYSSPVYPILGRHLHRDRKTTTALHPVLPMNKAVKQKRWRRWKGWKIYRRNILKNKKHSPEKRCYIFFWNLHIFPLKPVASFSERCYVFLWKALCLFERDATSFSSRQELHWCEVYGLDWRSVTTYLFTIT